MAIKPLRLHPEAEQEYLAALAWYQERSSAAARQFQNALEQAGQTIQRNPQRWPFYFGNFRKYTLHQFPFSVIYQEMISEVVIFAVAHGSRRPGYWKYRELL
jgi:plasmid stabilization system protein ParE